MTGVTDATCCSWFAYPARSRRVHWLTVTERRSLAGHWAHREPAPHGEMAVWAKPGRVSIGAFEGTSPCDRGGLRPAHRQANAPAGGAGAIRGSLRSTALVAVVDLRREPVADDPA